jgi:hypothetical protein
VLTFECRFSRTAGAPCPMRSVPSGIACMDLLGRGSVRHQASHERPPFAAANSSDSILRGFANPERPDQPLHAGAGNSRFNPATQQQQQECSVTSTLDSWRHVSTCIWSE